MSKKKRHDDIDELDELQNNALAEEETDIDYSQDTPTESENNNEDAEQNNDGKKNHRHRLMTSLLNNEGETNITSVKDLFKSINLNGEWFRRNLLFIVITTICLLAFVTNRYQAQQEQIEEGRLKKELTEMRYKWLTRFSELTSHTRESRIEEQLKQNGDTALHHSKDAPFLIRANK